MGLLDPNPGFVLSMSVSSVRCIPASDVAVGWEYLSVPSMPLGHGGNIPFVSVLLCSPSGLVWG